MAGNSSPPPPPRLTGDSETDFLPLQGWFNDLYHEAVLPASDRRALLQTTVTISGTATTGTSATFADQGSYKALAQASSFTGTPGAGSSTAVAVTNAATSVSLTVAVSPGSGNSVTFDVILFPVF